MHSSKRKARKPIKSEQYLTSEMDKSVTLTEDLRNTVEYIERGIVSIAFQRQSNGNSWAIQGPKKNLVVMLYYQNQSEISDVDDDIDDAISIKQESDINLAMNSRLNANNLEFKPTKLLKDGFMSSDLDKISILKNDLRNTIKDIVKDVVIISFHPQHQNNGNVWAIQRPKQNLIVMLYYENEFKFSDEDDSSDDEACIKQELNEDFLPGYQTKTTDVNMKFVDSSVVTANEVESILPDVDEAMLCPSEASIFPSNKRTSCSVLETFNSVIENVMHDLKYSDTYESELNHEMIVPEITIHHGLICDSNCAHNNSNEEMIHEKRSQYARCDTETDWNNKVQAGDKSCLNSVLNMKFYRKEDLEQSNVVLRRKKPYLCTECGKTFSSSGVLNRHKLIHSGERPHECPECGKKFSRKSVLVQHKELHLEEKPFQCEECGEKYCSKRKLDVHKKAHSDEKPFHCPMCERKFNTNAKLEQHIRIHTNEKPFECSVCEKSFRLKKNLVVHQRVHSGEKHYQCSVCGKKLADKLGLNRHMLIHSGEKPFECPECGKKFRFNGDLKTHRRVHSGEKPYRCSVCDQTFAKNSTLHQHKLVHSGEKPYKCSECGRRFTKVGTLNRHKLVHTGNKPHECPECGKTFALNSTLKRHLLYHSGVKPHECLECSKTFSQKCNLIKHQEVHTGEKPHECLLCGKRYSQKCALNKHKLLHNEEMFYGHGEMSYS